MSGDRLRDVEYETVRLPKPDVKKEYKEYISNVQQPTVKDSLKELVAETKTPPPAQAMRHNSGKLEWSLVDFQALEPMVKVLMFGAKKYSPNNWKKGLPLDKILDSLIRHIVELQQGKIRDEESKELVIGHILCNCMFLSHFIQKNLNQKSDGPKGHPPY